MYAQLEFISELISCRAAAPWESRVDGPWSGATKSCARGFGLIKLIRI